MQFIIIGRDGTDSHAAERRKDMREAHLAQVEKAVQSGEQLMGAAMLNNNGDMTGSVMIVDFPDRIALDQWLENEPYVTGRVWQDIEVIPCKIPPVFLKNH